MKNRRTLIAAIAAVSAISAATGVTSFAAKTLTEDKAEDKPAIVAEATTEAEEAAPELVKPEDKKEEAAKPEKDEAKKPAKHVGKKEIVDTINGTFDVEAKDFKDAESKEAWFDFIKNNLEAKLPAAPVAPEKDEKVKPEPPKPVEGEEAVKPEPPVAPEKDEKVKPEPPKGPKHGPKAEAEETTEAVEAE